MKPTIGNDLKIDIPRLLETRMLIQASSGGGKSWALRRILEQTAGHVQQVVLDIEGEFPTLREKFDYVICSPYGADAIATPQTAVILARRLRETRVSSIIDMYELKMPERKRFVRLFLEEFVEAPKSMWHPCIVVIDEAHHFCPEKDDAESMSAVNDLITRGRKRGLCGLLATQRLSKLSKDSAAELHNKLIGLAVLDTDVKRCADDLGMTPKEATPLLRNLEPGEFFIFGPALVRTVTKVKVGAVLTTHPKAGAGASMKPPEPSEKIKALLAKLTDLPKEAEQEARTVADFKRENANLKRELTLAKRANPAAKTEIKTIEKPVVGMKAIAGIQATEAEMRKTLKHMREIHAETASLLERTDGRVRMLAMEFEKVTKSQPTPRAAIANPPSVFIHKGNGTTAPSNLPRPQQRILDAIAWLESIGVAEPEQTAVAFLAHYTVGGGAFNNPKGSLRTAGLIEYRGDCLLLTDAGRALARISDTALTNEELHQRILQRLPGPERKLMAEVLSVYPQEIGDDELAERTNYSVGGGAFNNPKGRLRSLGLVTYPGSKRVRAADILFPESSP